MRCAIVARIACLEQTWVNRRAGHPQSQRRRCAWQLRRRRAQSGDVGRFPGDVPGVVHTEAVGEALSINVGPSLAAGG